MSGDVQTSCHGPIWFTLHVVAMGYSMKPSEEQRGHYIDWFNSWAFVLPSLECRKNFLVGVKACTIDGLDTFANQHTLFEFMWRLHNYFNQQNGKPSMTLYRCKEIYEPLRATVCNIPVWGQEKSCVSKTDGSQPVCLLTVIDGLRKNTEINVHARHESTVVAAVTNDNVQSSALGPIWCAMHLVAMGFPTKPTAADRLHYEAWLRSWGNVLPCCSCRKGLIANLSSLGFNESGVVEKHITANRYSMMDFVWRLHNKQNQNLGRRQVTFSAMKEFYDQFRCNRTTKHIIISIVPNKDAPAHRLQSVK